MPSVAPRECGQDRRDEAQDNCQAREHLAKAEEGALADVGDRCGKIGCWGANPLDFGAIGVRLDVLGAAGGSSDPDPNYMTTAVIDVGAGQSSFATDYVVRYTGLSDRIVPRQGH